MRRDATAPSRTITAKTTRTTLAASTAGATITENAAAGTTSTTPPASTTSTTIRTRLAGRDSINTVPTDRTIAPDATGPAIAVGPAVATIATGTTSRTCPRESRIPAIATGTTVATTDDYRAPGTIQAVGTAYSSAPGNTPRSSATTDRQQPCRHPSHIHLVAIR